MEQIIWSTQAQVSLNLLMFYASKSIEAADREILEVFDAIESIHFIKQYQTDEVLGEPYQRIIVRHLKVISRIDNNQLRVIEIFDKRQNPNKLRSV